MNNYRAVNADKSFNFEAQDVEGAVRLVQSTASDDQHGYDLVDNQGRLVAMVAPNAEATQVMAWTKIKA